MNSNSSIKTPRTFLYQWGKITRKEGGGRKHNLDYSPRHVAYPPSSGLCRSPSDIYTPAWIGVYWHHPQPLYLSPGHQGNSTLVYINTNLIFEHGNKEKLPINS